MAVNSQDITSQSVVSHKSAPRAAYEATRLFEESLTHGEIGSSSLTRSPSPRRTTLGVFAYSTGVSTTIESFGVSLSH